MASLNWFERIPDKYQWDRREFGRLLVVVSAAIMILSLHSTVVLQSTINDIGETGEELDRAQGMMNTQGFNQSLQAISSLETYEDVDVSNQFTQASSAFQVAFNSTERMDETENQLKANLDLYRWLVLISILGVVAGIAEIYLQ